jgi:hypothetical protein
MNDVSPCQRCRNVLRTKDNTELNFDDFMNLLSIPNPPFCNVVIQHLDRLFLGLEIDENMYKKLCYEICDIFTTRLDPRGQLTNETGEPFQKNLLNQIHIGVVESII